LSKEHKTLYLTAFQRKLLLKKLCEDTLSPLNRQRIKIMILADEGLPQAAICLEVGCCATTARHWIQMARSGMAHLWEESPRGRPKIVTDAYLERLRELLTQSPRDYKYPFSRWTAGWLHKHLAQEYDIEVSFRHFKRLLKQVKDAINFNAAIRPTEVALIHRNCLSQDNITADLSHQSNLKIADLTLEGKPQFSKSPSVPLTHAKQNLGLYGNFNV
jgi:transposase